MTNDLIASLPTRRALVTTIEHLDIAADAKVLLVRLADVTADIGGATLYVGRRILAFVLEAIRLFPHITLGVIVAFVIGQLIASVAILGALLGPLLAPLLLAFGIGAGAVMDVADGKFRERVEGLTASFVTPVHG
jgi:hypothetical protein